MSVASKIIASIASASRGMRSNLNVNIPHLHQSLKGHRMENNHFQHPPSPTCCRHTLSSTICEAAFSDANCRKRERGSHIVMMMRLGICWTLNQRFVRGHLILNRSQESKLQLTRSLFVVDKSSDWRLPLGLICAWCRSENTSEWQNGASLREPALSTFTLCPSHCGIHLSASSIR